VVSLPGSAGLACSAGFLSALWPKDAVGEDAAGRAASTAAQAKDARGGHTGRAIGSSLSGALPGSARGELPLPPQSGRIVVGSAPAPPFVNGGKRLVCPDAIDGSDNTPQAVGRADLGSGVALR